MKKRGASKFVAAVLMLAALALMVVSVIQRDAGQLWMPWLHVAAWAVLMVGVAVFTYDPEEAASARKLYGELPAEGETKKAA